MKLIFPAILIGFGLIAGEGLVRAQTSDKPLPVPKAPYLAPVPDYGHWTVTLKYGEAAAADPSSGPAKLPASIDTIKTGELRGVVLTYPDGTSKQFTCQGDWVLASTSKGPQLGVAGPSWTPYVYYTKGFILFDGVTINPSTYKETAMHDGTLAFHYKSGSVDIWIDPTTMLPLAVKKPDIAAAYQFLPAPPRPFKIPEDQAALLQKEQEADQKIRALR